MGPLGSAAPDPSARGFASDVLDEVLRSGPFHVALRLAIEVRGLGLERLRDRLARRGLRVSVSTLSNWQRGLSRPDRPRSRQALAALEELLEVPGGALSRLLGPAPGRARARSGIDPGTPR